MPSSITVRSRIHRRGAVVAAVLVAAVVGLTVGVALPAGAASHDSTATKALKEAKLALRRANAAHHAASVAAHATIGTSRLAAGAVTTSQIAAGAVTTPNLAGGAVSLAKLSGEDVAATFDLPALGAGTCGTAEITVPGGAVGQFPMVAFPGPTNLPLAVSATVLRIDVAGSLRVKFCNASASDAAGVTGVNAQVLALD